MHEKEQKECAVAYPDGIHAHIARFLSAAGYDVKTAVLDEPEHGLTDDVLENTDVLIWWGHAAHSRVSDAVAKRAYVFARYVAVAVYCGAAPIVNNVRK